MSAHPFKTVARNVVIPDLIQITMINDLVDENKNYFL